jgi:hypothetical protein
VTAGSPYPWGGLFRPASRLTAAWAREIRQDPLLRQVVQVVELSYGDGRIYRVATQALSTTDAQGDAVEIVPALLAEAEVDNTYDLGSASATSRTLQYEVEARAVEADRRMAAGIPLQGFAEVSLLAPGMAWEDRRVLVRGDVAGGVQVGVVRRGTRIPGGDRTFDGQVLQFEVQDPRLSADLPFPVAAVTDDTWPAAFPGSIGQVYTVAYGSVTVEARRTSSSTSTPAWVAAFGHGWVVSHVWRNGDLVTGDFTASESADREGNPVTLVVPDLGAFVWEDGDRVVVALTDPDPEPDLLAVVRDVIERWGPDAALANRQLFAEAGAVLRMPCVAQANDQSTVLQWVEGGQLEDFPMVAMIFEDGGYGPIVTDYRRPPRTQIEARTGRLPFRLTDPQESPKEDAFNAFTLRYAYDRQVDQFTGYAEVDAGTSAICRASEGSLGRRVHPVVESIQIASDLSARQVLDWMAAHLTLTTWYVEYAGRPDLFFELRRGDTVELTDPDFGWSAARATVERLSYRRAFLTLGLRVWGSPFRRV